MPGVEGDGVAGAAQLTDQAPGAGDFPAGAVRVGLAQHHAIAVADGGQQHAVLVGAGAPVHRGSLAVQGQRAGGGLAGRCETPDGRI